MALVMRIAAIIVTKGDQRLEPILESLPSDWDWVIWDNGKKRVLVNGASFDVADLSVYGRYAAIEYTDAELISVQDDDCIVSDPQALVDAWHEADGGSVEKETHWGWGGVVCNMPPEFRHDFYEDHALVGFGAVFHRDAPQRAFRKFAGAGPTDQWWMTEEGLRTCDIVFTALTPRVLVDVPVENLPWAYHYDRMWRQPEHQAERVRMLDLVRQIAA